MSEWKRIYFTSWGDPAEAELAEWLREQFGITPEAENAFLSRTERRQVGELFYEEFALVCRDKTFQKVRDGLLGETKLADCLHHVLLPPEENDPYMRRLWGPQGEVDIEQTDNRGKKVGMSPVAMARSGGW